MTHSQIEAAVTVGAFKPATHKHNLEVSAKPSTRSADRTRGSSQPNPDNARGNACERQGSTKSEIVLKKLRTRKGATVQEIMLATGWQAHSVRGFLSGTVKKRLGFGISCDIGKDGGRRYRINNASLAR